MNILSQVRAMGAAVHKNSSGLVVPKIAHLSSLFLFFHPTELKDGEAQLAVPLTSPQYSPQMKGSFNVLTA